MARVLRVCKIALLTVKSGKVRVAQMTSQTGADLRPKSRIVETFQRRRSLSEHAQRFLRYA